MNIIFQINGGIGKSVMATAVCENIKIQYPDDNLIVVTAYPEVFLNNPNVNRCLGMGTFNYFYPDYIKDKDIKLMLQEPYLEAAHVQQTEHLVETWCKMNGIECHTTKPSLFFTEREINFHSQKYVSDKPILIMQTNGGAAEQEQKYSWARDIPYHVVDKIIQKYSETHTIFHIRREDQIAYPNTVAIHDSLRSIAIGMMRSSKRLLMDSFAHHVATALNLPSTVLWVVNSPTVFGYDMHDNIIANKPTRPYDFRHSYLQPYNITGDIIEFPYNSELDLFYTDDIIKSLN
jgi:hypothetical protein